MTANDLTRRILMSIGVIGEEDVPTAAQASDTFVSINQFLSSIGGSEGFVTYQYPNPTVDIGLPDGYELMIQTNVAVMVAPDYGREATLTTQRLATATKRTLKRQSMPVPVLKVDPLILQFGQGSGYNIYTDEYQ